GKWAQCLSLQNSRRFKAVVLAFSTWAKARRW
ncbi:MAG: hypothetical protein ACI9B8_002796, partial [Sulfitobacter sp.]